VEDATFEEWLNNSASEEIIAKVASSYSCAREIKTDWLAKHGKSKRPKPPYQAKREYRPSKSHVRTSRAIEYNAWRSADGKDTNQPHVDFMRTIHRYKNDVVPKKDTVWLRRLLTRHNKPLHERVAKTGRHKHRLNSKSVPDAYRERDIGTQGAPLKCPVIGEMLWDWFVDMRRSFAAAVSPRFILNKAVLIAESCLKEMEKQVLSFQFLRLIVTGYSVGSTGAASFGVGPTQSSSSLGQL
jgi:hypothetical protein